MRHAKQNKSSSSYKKECDKLKATNNTHTKLPTKEFVLKDILHNNESMLGTIMTDFFLQLIFSFMKNRIYQITLIKHTHSYTEVKMSIKFYYQHLIFLHCYWF